MDQPSHLSLQGFGWSSPKHFRQLYNVVAIPAFTYAADVWFVDIHLSSSGLKHLGSVALVTKLASIQRQAAKLITGSLRTAAGDVLEVHANLLPMELLLRKILFRSATRLAYLPSSHPLSKPVCRSASRYVRKHRSPLHYIFYTTSIIPSTVETVSPVRRRPSYLPKFSTTILSEKEKALAAAISLHSTTFTVYCDGSGYENGVGAAAVMFINKTDSQSLKLHLGPSSRHTVYEAELIGISLALCLLLSFPRAIPLTYYHRYR